MRTLSSWCPLALALACGLAAASPARAQQKQPYREGFWIGVGLGYGSATISCSSCTDNQRYGALSGTLRLGGTLSKHVLLGVETNGWTRQVAGVAETVGDLSAVLFYYPSLTSTLHIKGGLGFVVYNLDSSPSVTTNGVGINLGAGLDLYTGRKFSLTPYVNFVTAVSGTVKIGGVDTGFDARPNLLQVGVAATWH